jgi:uncharacterized protein DUF4160
MPTVFSFRGLRVSIFTQDHRPSHVDVSDANGRAAFFLNCPDGPLELRAVTYGFNARQINRIIAALADQIAELCQKWREIHGDY